MGKFMSMIFFVKIDVLIKVRWFFIEFKVLINVGFIGIVM